MCVCVCVCVHLTCVCVCARVCVVIFNTIEQDGLLGVFASTMRSSLNGKKSSKFRYCQ